MGQAIEYDTGAQIRELRHEFAVSLGRGGSRTARFSRLGINRLLALVDEDMDSAGTVLGLIRAAAETQIPRGVHAVRGYMAEMLSKTLAYGERRNPGAEELVDHLQRYDLGQPALTDHTNDDALATAGGNGHGYGYFEKP